MDSLLEDQALQAVLGRTDFGGIDNGGLDFSQLEQYINDQSSPVPPPPPSSTSPPANPNTLHNTTLYFSEGLASGLEAGALQFALNNNHPQASSASTCNQQAYLNFSDTNIRPLNDARPGAASNSLKLPESPPDSGSEPPFSPQSDHHLHQQHHNHQSSSNDSNRPLTQAGGNMDNMKHFVDYGTLSNGGSYTTLGSLSHQQQVSVPTVQHAHHHLQEHHSVPQAGVALPMLEGVGGLLHHAANVYVGETYQTHVLVGPCPSTSSLPNADLASVYGPSVTSLLPPSHTTLANGKKRKTMEASTCNSKQSTNGRRELVMETTPTATSIYVKQEALGALSPDSGLPVSGTSGNGSSDGGSTTSTNSNGCAPPQQQQTNGGAVVATAGTTNAIQCGTEDYDFGDYGTDSQMYDAFYQCIRFTPFNVQSCCTLYDANFKETAPVNYHVDADKGFNYSNADEAFVCQKKNHFQVTVHIQTYSTPVYVRPVGGEAILKVDSFSLHFYGVKVESPTQTIKVEQSQSDRSKKAFHPVVVDVSSDHVTKLTVGRLHFSETTSNNMRKKGKPNPDQRYFNLVVALCAHVGDEIHQVAAQASERIIVRASNPGQFESDVELIWQKGSSPDSIFHSGRVGINTDRPDEALVVMGNAKVTGNIMQPSDERAKTNIEEVDTREQLKNVSAMRIVRYQFKQDFAQEVGLRVEDRAGTGVLAQEVARIIPEAVKETGDIVLPSGETIEKFLVVNKDRIFMENLGAVKELCKVTDNLEMRIDELEKMNTKLSKFNRFDSIKSCSVLSRTSLVSSFAGSACSTSREAASHRGGTRRRQDGNTAKARAVEVQTPTVCTNRFIQTIIMILVFIMAFCLASIATLYILEYHRRHHHLGPPPVYAPGPAPRYGYPNVDNIDYHHYPSQSSISSFPSPSSLSTTIHGKAPNSIDGFKDSKKEAQSSSVRTNNPIHQSQWPTAIPILRPQVLGIPYGCLEQSSGGSSCSVYCCVDETHTNNNFGLHAHEPGLVVVGGREPSSDVANVNQTDQSDGSVGESKHYASTLPLPTPGIIAAKPTAGNAPVDVVLKKKRTDKGLNLGKFANSRGIQDIHGLNDFEDSKSSLLTRRRRETGKTADYNHKQNIHNMPRKDLSKTVDGIKLIELNATIDYSYCTKLQCTQGLGSRFHYIIPVSKYMDYEYVTLQLSLSQEMKVDHCEGKSSQPTGCHSANGQYENLPIYNKKTVASVDNVAAPLMAESNPHWRLPIGIYLRSVYVFRILARHVDVDTPCNLPESQLGASYIEYKFEFVRKCDK